MQDEVVADFLDYLRRAAFPRAFLPVYERECRRFLSAFPDRRAYDLGHDEVSAYLGAAKAAGATDQQLKDLKVVADAVVWFLKHRSPTRSIPPPGTTSPTPSGRGRRQHKRVAFIRDVLVHGLGPARSSDLSHGGMFLEMMSNVSVGAELDISFHVFLDDPQLVTARTRVVYQHAQVGVGLMFIAISPEGQSLVDGYVASSPESDAVG